MKDNTKARVKFYVDRKSRFVHDAALFMLLSAVFRILGCWGMWDDRFFALTQILLPIACNVLFVVCLLLLGEKAFASTVLPVLLGVVFFIIKSMGFESKVHMILCVLLYIAVAILYTATAIGVIRTKWLLVPLFGIPFLYHVVIEDAPALADKANPLLFSDGMQELSVLAIMLALFFTALAMKKRKELEDAQLPKIKDPVVLVPEKPKTVGTENPAAAAEPVGGSDLPMNSEVQAERETELPS